MFDSPFSGLVSVILVLFLIGGLATLALTGSDLTNFMANRAKAEAMTQQNEIDAQRAKIDLEYYKAIQANQVQAQIERTNAENDAYQRSLEQETALQQAQAIQNMQLDAQKAAQEIETSRLFKITMGISIIVLAILLGLGACIYFVQLGRSHLIAAKADAKVIDPWDNLAWRNHIIAISREKSRSRNSGSINESAIPFEIPVEWETFTGKK